MTPCICCIAIFYIHIHSTIYCCISTRYCNDERQDEREFKKGGSKLQVALGRALLWISSMVSSNIILSPPLFIATMEALYHALLFVVFCLVLSPISFCKAFSNPTQNRQQSSSVSSLQLKTNNIIERDDVSVTSRRSFFISTATLAGSSLFHPLEANAVTDCFKDCVKNCKLIAPKVRYDFVHCIFVIRHSYCICLLGSTIL